MIWAAALTSGVRHPANREPRMDLHLDGRSHHSRLSQRRFSRPRRAGTRHMALRLEVSVVR